MHFIFYESTSYQSTSTVHLNLQHGDFFPHIINDIYIFYFNDRSLKP